MTADDKTTVPSPPRPRGMPANSGLSEFGWAPNGLLDWIDGLPSEEAHRVLDWLAVHKVGAVRAAFHQWQRQEEPNE